jgi:hypothetical protein
MYFAAVASDVMTQTFISLSIPNLKTYELLLRNTVRYVFIKNVYR